MAISNHFADFGDEGPLEGIFGICCGRSKSNVFGGVRMAISCHFIDFGDEVICYRLLKREPAKMDSKGTGRPHRKATYSYEYSNPKAPGRILVVESRPVDHKIEFTCWAKTNKMANKRALWFEKLMINHGWIFEYHGAERFHWIDRGADTYTTSNSQRLVFRPINFFLRFREFEIKTYPTIKNIVLENKLL